MSTRDEQYRAILRAREYVRDQFDYWVMWRGRLWRTPLRKWAQNKVDRAYWCLRHFPFLYEDGRPMWKELRDTKE